MAANIGGSASNEEGAIKEQDRLLPIANVGRIMKQSLPTNAKISKEAKETMQECVSEFISFLTSEASEKCRKERRKTVNGDDICWALGALGFDEYAGALKRYLNRYRETEGERAHQERANTSEEVEEPSGNRNPLAQSWIHEGEASTSLRFNVIDRTKSSSSRPC